MLGMRLKKEQGARKLKERPLDLLLFTLSHVCNYFKFNLASMKFLMVKYGSIFGSAERANCRDVKAFNSFAIS